MTLSVSLLCLLVVVVLGAYLFSPSVPVSQEAREEVIEEITECLKDGNVKVMKELLSSRLAPNSFKAGASNKTGIFADNKPITGINVTNNKKEDGPVSDIKISNMVKNGATIPGIPGSNGSTVKIKKVAANPFHSPLGETGHSAGSALQSLVDNFDKIQELARRGKMYIATEEDGDIVTGTILIDSPRGFYALRVKLKKIDGKWVIIETLE